MQNNRLYPEDIEQLLQELAEKLATRGEQGTVILGGGAVMAMCYSSRASTLDVDALFEPATEIREFVSAIAEERGLETDWLNDGIKGFINPKTAKVVPFKQYSGLTVLRFDTETMLALKLLSARMDSDKDRVDALTLLKEIDYTDVDQLFNLVQKYGYTNQLTPKVQYFILDVFEEYMGLEAQEKTGAQTPTLREALADCNTAAASQIPTELGEPQQESTPEEGSSEL